jgi:putative NADH-flavin reductase
MSGINADTSLKEVAALVSQALERAGVTATLSGGGAVSLYTDNQSLDQAVMVASRQQIDWPALHEWARRDGVDTSVIGSLRSRVERIHSAEGSGQNG